MANHRPTRRDFLKVSGGLAAAGGLLPAWLGDLAFGAKNAFAAGEEANGMISRAQREPYRIG